MFYRECSEKNMITMSIQVTSAQKKEIDRRMALDKEGKMSWYTIKEAKSKLRTV